MQLNSSKVFILFMTLAMFLSTGCLDLLGGYEKIEGDGAVIETERDMKGFSGVHLATIGDMYIEFGESESFVIEAQENLHDYFDVYIKSDVLIVDTKEGYSIKTDKPLKFYVTMKSLDYVRISSSGDVHAPDIEADDFEVHVSSSGDYDLGDLQCSDLEIRVSSSGDVSMGDVNSDRTDLSISSSGDITLGNVISPTFEARISSSGDINIDYLESSEVYARISSSGDIFIKDGSAPHQNISISSSGNYKASGLNADEAVIRISSSGNAYVDVGRNLEATLSSSGSVYYSGSPALHVKERSSGQVRKSD